MPPPRASGDSKSDERSPTDRHSESERVLRERAVQLPAGGQGSRFLRLYNVKYAIQLMVDSIADLGADVSAYARP